MNHGNNIDNMNNKNHIRRINNIDQYMILIIHGTNNNIKQTEKISNINYVKYYESNRKHTTCVILIIYKYEQKS